MPRCEGPVALRVGGGQGRSVDRGRVDRAHWQRRGWHRRGWQRRGWQRDGPVCRLSHRPGRARGSRLRSSGLPAPAAPSSSGVVGGAPVEGVRDTPTSGRRRPVGRKIGRPLGALRSTAARGLGGLLRPSGRRDARGSSGSRRAHVGRTFLAVRVCESPRRAPDPGGERDRDGPAADWHGALPWPPGRRDAAARRGRHGDRGSAPSPGRPAHPGPGLRAGLSGPGLPRDCRLAGAKTPRPLGGTIQGWVPTRLRSDERAILGPGVLTRARTPGRRRREGAGRSSLGVSSLPVALVRGRWRATRSGLGRGATAAARVRVRGLGTLPGAGRPSVQKEVQKEMACTRRPPPRPLGPGALLSRSESDGRPHVGIPVRREATSAPAGRRLLWWSRGRAVQRPSAFGSPSPFGGGPAFGGVPGSVWRGSCRFPPGRGSPWVTEASRTVFTAAPARVDRRRHPGPAAGPRRRSGERAREEAPANPCPPVLVRAARRDVPRRYRSGLRACARSPPGAGPGVLFGGRRRVSPRGRP